MALVWIDPNYFGSLCSNPNKIQTNDMVGGVMYFCLCGKKYMFSSIFFFKYLWTTHVHFIGGAHGLNIWTSKIGIDCLDMA